ncbi:MAG TPA: S8 family serine peptidase, partial [Candidatus Saccharimonadales bacterium]|nr:S8 family serine peptidase [Candidatus Saccharimonadales bacterium]
AGDVRFDVRRGEPPIADAWKAAPAAPGLLRPLLVKFEAPEKAAWLDEIRAAGGEIVQYQPDFGYLVFGPPGIRSRLESIHHVEFTGEYHGEYKAPAALRARSGDDGTITLRVVYFDLPGYGAGMDDVLARGARLLRLEDGTSTSQWSLLHYAVFENVRLSDLPAVLGRPEVYWAEEWFPPQVEDERAAQITAGNVAAGQPLTGYYPWLASIGADGTGVTLAVADTGLDTGNPATIHPDFTGRVSFATALCTNNRDRDGHGTNVSGIALGDPRLPTGTGLTDSNGFYWGTGSAPGAHLYFQKALDSGDCGTTWAGQPNTLAADAVTAGGAELGTHSFTDGLTPGNGYTSTAQAWDARVRDADANVPGNQPYAAIFSAGNSGPSAGSLTSPKAAKNIITVGATENYRPTQCPSDPGCGGLADDIDALISFSSRGPTVDNRFKPEIVVPGHVITGPISSQASYSCFCDGGGGSGCCASTGIGSGEYSAYSGTSQASPRAAGASAVVFDWFKNRFGSFPSPAMNKAILINGAVDLGAADTPNNNEGWGRVNLSASLADPHPGVYVDQSSVIGSVGAGGAFSGTYYVQDAGSPVRATLAWTDAPGAVSCNPCLVNDLDLSVTDGTSTWRGNNFAGGFSTTATTTDSLNNVEGIKLPPGAVCLPFQVTVEAKTLGGDGVPGNGDSTDQDFALVVSNASTTPGPAALHVTGSSGSGGCDSDGFLDRRETMDLAVDVSNCGMAATGVQATLSVDSAPAGASITVSPSGPVAIGSVGTGGTAQNTWQVSLGDSASSFCGQKATLRVDFTDDSSHSWTDYVDVTLDADAFGLVTNTDPADTDNSFSAAADWALDSCRVTSPSTSWHMGSSDCTGIPRDAAAHDLVFSYTLGSSDVLRDLSFQHAFGGYQNSGGTLRDSVEVDIDPENDGTYVTLQSWAQGLGNPTTMTAAGPFDLSGFNATRSNTIKIRFRFQSAASWVGGPNNASGWDVDDIVLTYDTLSCDAGSCPACSSPSGLTNNGAADLVSCQASGVQVSWAQDASSWNDGGSGMRQYVVFRDGSPVQAGGCAGPIPYATTSCVDDTAGAGVMHTYSVQYENGCGSQAATAGAAATDLASAPPAVNDGASGGNPVEISMSGSDITLSWDTAMCAVRYNVYAGTPSGYWDHAIFSAAGLDGADSCFEPGTSVTFADPSPGQSLYFLVAADNGLLESDLGSSTPMTPRPWASPACSPH